MNRRIYKSPVLKELDDGGSHEITFGGSQGTSGFDSMWTWDESIDDLIGMYDDTDLQAMDVDGDYHITEDELYNYMNG